MTVRASQEILLIEDNPGDVRLVQLAFEKSGWPGALRVARDGIEGVAYLRQATPFEAAARPDMVLLDINMPRKNGHQVLQEVKQDATLRSIPIFIFTSSDADQDVRLAYHAHANGYLVKPPTFGELLELMRRFEAFWVRHVTPSPSLPMPSGPAA